MSLRLAIDFDGTLVQDQEPLALLPGVPAALQALKGAGHSLVLFSARCTPLDPGPNLDDEIARYYQSGEVAARVTDQWERFERMRDFLQAQGLWELFDLVWQAPGKPPADLYIDDRAEPPDWKRLTAELGQRGGEA